MSAEWSFIVACCRQVSRGSAADRLRAAAAAGLDWPLVAAVARRHRVEGLVHKALSEAGVASPFRVVAAEIARRNLAHVAEAKRLHDALDEAGIVHLFVKGATLDMLAWKSIAFKRAIDIDVLVDRSRYADACAMLRGDGYLCVPPYPGELPIPDILAYADRAKDSVWRHPESDITVELHLRLTANPALLPGVSVRSPSQIVEVAPNIALPTLARDELFAYLCVHGALTAWSRLKWAADLTALIDPEEHLDGLYGRASALAPRRAVALALLVCESLFGLPLGRLGEDLRRDGRTRWLLRTALATMVRGGPERELADQRFGTARLHFSLLFLEPGLRYKGAELRRQLKRLAARR